LGTGFRMNIKHIWHKEESEYFVSSRKDDIGIRANELR